MQHLPQITGFTHRACLHHRMTSVSSIHPSITWGWIRETYKFMEIVISTHLNSVSVVFILQNSRVINFLEEIDY